jgi:hypothetical protein
MSAAMNASSNATFGSFDQSSGGGTSFGNFSQAAAGNSGNSGWAPGLNASNPFNAAAGNNNSNPWASSAAPVFGSTAFSNRRA